MASLLPTLVGAHAHVLVASRPYPELPDDVPDGHPLRATSPVELDPFEGAEELADLARQEIDDLTRGDDLELAVDVLGLLTAAAGPLSVRGPGRRSRTARLDHPPPTRFRSRRLVTERAARSLEPVGSDGHRATSSPTTRCWSTPRRTRTWPTRSSETESTSGPTVARRRLADTDGRHRTHAAVPARQLPGDADRRAGSAGGAGQRRRMGRRGDPGGRRRPCPRRPSAAPPPPPRPTRPSGRCSRPSRARLTT